MSDATSRVPVPDNDLLDGRYRLIERLGHGGMATVWRGYDERLSRTVAVKVLDGPLLHDAAARTQILLEARALARLTHPHIAHVYDSGSTGDGVPYLVMELVDGPSLASVLATRQVLAWRTAVSVCAQVADALAAAHARGFVHRDVSAANVLLAPAGVKLIDFGICAIEGQPQTDADGQLLGTPAYVAPERLHARPVAPPADVYSVGMLLYRALSGRLPWDVATPTELLIAAQRTDPRPLPPVDGLPATIAETCLRCLARDPEDRPPAIELADQLNTAVGTAAPVDPSPGDGGNGWDAMTHVLPWTATIDGARTRGRPRRPGAVTVLAVAVGVIVTGATAWLATAWGPADDPATVPALAAPPPVAASGSAPCTATYRITGDTGSRFTATISVRNTGGAHPSGWRLALDLPGGQRIDTAQAVEWSQDGPTVTSAPQPAALAPGAAAELALSGGYSGANPLPTVFRLDGQLCAATVLGPPGTTPATGDSPNAPATGGNQDQRGGKGGGKGKHRGSG